jgi:EAL domain-containing protein (putative c-di-GMP-specific phosphodiesterase class I)
MLSALALQDCPQVHRALLTQAEAKHDDFVRAVENHEFTLFYQPQVDLTSGAIVGAEALLRWDHPTSGLRDAGSFVGDLEASPSLQLLVGDWLIREVCRQLHQWRADGHKAPTIAVNLFPAQLDNPELCDAVAHWLSIYGVEPGDIELEITEKTEITTERLNTIDMLRSMGIAIALDDFGTANAGFESIARVPATTIKVDKSFVDRLTMDVRSVAIIRSILSLARDLNMKVVAEGIEKQTQASALHALGCAIGQGWLFSKAVSAGDFLQLMRPAVS